MLRWGLDWLMKVSTIGFLYQHHDLASFRRILPTTLYMFLREMVSQPTLPFCCLTLKNTSLADIDNAYWGGDLDIPTPRPSYQINDTHPGTDAAAGASAAFSACSNLYSSRTFNGPYQPPASLNDTSYAEKLLTHAQDLYSFAINAKGGMKTYQKSVPAVADSYGSSSYEDEVTIAALLLAWATKDTSLYQQAEDYYKKFGLAGNDGVFNWDSKTPGIAVLFAQIAQSDSPLGGNLSTWQAEAERYFDNIINSQGRALMTKSLLFSLYHHGSQSDFS
jgi:endoglucanase